MTIARKAVTYLTTSLPSDLVAGIVIAALSIPISMGYAELAGMPAIYGLYASIIAPIAFAVLTKTKKTVFGMDSATTAMTASMLALVGVASAQTTIAAMPVLTLFSAIFLLIFAAIRAGTFIKMIPIPVIHGFIFGIAVTVIVGQIPHLMGVSLTVSGSIADEIPQIISAAPAASLSCVVISLVSIALLFASKKFLPKFPSAIIVLLVATGAAQLLSSSSASIIYLPQVDGSLPSAVDVFAMDFSSLNYPALLAAAFAIAIVISLESLLCLEAFSGAEDVMFSPNREMIALGGSNLALSLFACPPCSASMSRTAAGISSGAKTQMASIFSALVVAIVALFAGSFMGLVPRCALSAIVVVALFDIVDWKKMATYVTKLRYDFIVFSISALLVILFGAVVGIIGGIIISVAIMSYSRRQEDVELVGAVPYPVTKDIDKEKVLNSSSVAVCKLPDTLTFANAAKTLNDIEKKASGKDVLVIKASKLSRTDSSAADRLRSLLDVLAGAGTQVKIVRKIRETKGHVTRYEIRRLMRDYDTYPSLPAALESLERESKQDIAIDAATGQLPILERREMIGLDLQPQLPVVTIQALRDLEGNIVMDDAPSEVLIEDVRGKLSLMNKKTAYIFKAEYSEDAKHTKQAKQQAYGKNLFSKIMVYDEKNDHVIMDYRDGHHLTDELDARDYSLIASQIAFCVSQIVEKQI